MNTLKTVSKILTIGIIFLCTVSFVDAFVYQSAENSGFDASISDQTYTEYANPTKFYITQVTTDAKDLEDNSEQWVFALYYYSITRLKFADIPYNFLIDEYGQIYEGRSGGIGSNPELKNIDGAITVGYLSNNAMLTTRAEQSLQNLVEDTSKKWGISEYSTVTLQMSESENSLTTVVPVAIENDFASSVKDALADWEGYTEEDLTYITEIVSVVHEESVEIGNKLNVKVTIKNNNDFPWFTDKDPIYASIKEGKESSFAINGIWDSFSKPAKISDKVVKPGEEVELSFDLQAKITPGEASESFEILKYADKPFGNSAFSVSFNVIKGDNKLVEIYSPQYGFVNVRECPRYNCEIIDSVDEGTVFIEIERNEDAWVKIQYDENTEGWVYVKYIKSI